MSYVPAYQHDIFISYAHGDDRDWINLFVDRLRQTIRRRLGVEARIWIDDDTLRRTRDFRKEIPDSLKSSAVFLLLPSPTYIRSAYCVNEECEAFKKTLSDRRAHFRTDDFGNEQFALRCPILPIENDEHWQLFEGLTDIRFCSETDTFAIDTPEFETSFRRLIGELVTLLNRMRNHSTPVFLYPRTPGLDLKDAYKALSEELSAQGYRLLPDSLLSLTAQLQNASLSVFLVGDTYDETALELVKIASQQPKPWVVWCSPPSEQNATPNQMGFYRFLEQHDSATKTYLKANITPGKLKEEVLALLRPSPRSLPPPGGKPRVYLIYNPRDPTEKGNAGLISILFHNEFDFDHPDPSQHKFRLTNSDGVLLIWGSAEQAYWERDFEEIILTPRRALAKGLCLFEPKETKTAVLDQIREKFTDIHITEQFGSKFEPARMETFFTPIRRRLQAGQS